jgi:hypothetical protein
MLQNYPELLIVLLSYCIIFIFFGSGTLKTPFIIKSRRKVPGINYY